ncbi:MAG: DUF1232 domain-containing protein [Ignavibacteriales bacterium]|nr:DUF1232 domain-containing protein [Ignavibacteriales bacterium]
MKSKLIKGTRTKVQSVKNNFWQKMKETPSRLYGDAVALYRYMKDPDVFWARKAIAVGALTYLISPVDAIPDVIPFIGYTDDAAIIAAAVNYLWYELEDYYD